MGKALKDQKSCVIDDETQVFLALGSCPADELISGSDFPCCGRPAKAGDGLSRGVNEITKL
jgi:hypothetical protein